MKAQPKPTPIVNGDLKLDKDMKKESAQAVNKTIGGNK